MDPRGFYAGLSQGLHSNGTLSSRECSAGWGALGVSVIDLGAAGKGMSVVSVLGRRADLDSCRGFLPEVHVHAVGLLTGCFTCLTLNVTTLRYVLLLNEARHCHGNTALRSQPDAKPLNYIFLAESASIASGLQSNGTVGGTRCLTLISNLSTMPKR